MINDLFCINLTILDVLRDTKSNISSYLEGIDRMTCGRSVVYETMKIQI